MEQKNHDKIRVRLRAFFSCQQQLESQCTLLAEQLAINEVYAMVNKNLRMVSRSNQARQDGELQQDKMLTNDISVILCCSVLEPLFHRIFCGSCI